MNERTKGRAFGFIPVWVNAGGGIECRYRWADWLFEIVAPIWGFFCSISGHVPEGFPVKVRAEDAER